MIDKEEFYYGAALRLLLHHSRVKSVRQEEFGYLINDQHFVFLKYVTKARSPWHFGFGQDDLNLLNVQSRKYQSVTGGLICGGDGVCAISLKNLNIALGYAAGSIAIKRRFNEQYGVKGSAEALPGKTSLSAWPNLILNAGN